MRKSRLTKQMKIRGEAGEIKAREVGALVVILLEAHLYSFGRECSSSISVRRVTLTCVCYSKRTNICY